MIWNKRNSFITTIIVLIVVFSAGSDNSVSCEPEQYPPPPEITWPLNQEVSVPLDTAIIVKDFKLPSKNPPGLDIEITDSSGSKIEFNTKRIQSRRSVYNYEAGFIILKPDENLKPQENYTLSVKASEGFAEPINQSITFYTGGSDVLAISPENIDVSYYLSEPGYYLSNCQTSVWDKATSLIFMNSQIESYPVLLVLESNLLKDVSFFHSSMEKRNLAILFLPNEKGHKQCFNLSAHSVSGEKFYSEKLCKPSRCVQGEYLSKEQAKEEYDKHGAFGFSMIEFPKPEKELPNYCTLYPPLCKEYWASIPENNCKAEN
jgi:hypothetical protein